MRTERGPDGAQRLLELAPDRGALHGTAEQIIDQLGKLAGLGVSEVQLQHMDFDDDPVPQFFAKEETPHMKHL